MSFDFDQFSVFGFQCTGRSCDLVGLRRLELPTSRLSGVRYNRLSYKPEGIANFEEICYRNSNALVEFRRGAFRVAEVFHEATLLPARIEIGLKLKAFVELLIY